MTAAEFFLNHRIYHSSLNDGVKTRNVAMVVDIRTGVSRTFNFEFTNDDILNFLLFTGNDLSDLANDELVDLIIESYKITE
jgi:hypothetical protein